MSTQLGILCTAIAGLLSGTSAWPMKKMKKPQFEHWWFLGMLVGLIIIPWAGVLLFCPRPFEAYASVPAADLIRANAFAFAWGIANLLCGICFVRVGVALSGAMIAGLGVSVGVTLPLIMKGSGLFSHAPDIGSRAGLVILGGVGVMLIGVVLVALAGLGRDRAQSGCKRPSGGIVLSLVLCVISGVTSAGFGLSFVYGQGPIVAAMKANGAGDIPANLAVWAGALASGAIINVLYPMWLLTRNRSWRVLFSSGSEAVLASVIGAQLILGAILMGRGMLLLGTLGGSVGFGIQQAAQMLGNQGLGFVSGEWKGVSGRPVRQMIAAIAILVVAAAILGYGNTL